jgi:hypothetical protein
MRKGSLSAILRGEKNSNAAQALQSQEEQLLPLRLDVFEKLALYIELHGKFYYVFFTPNPAQISFSLIRIEGLSEEGVFRVPGLKNEIDELVSLCHHAGTLTSEGFFEKKKTKTLYLKIYTHISQNHSFQPNEKKTFQTWIYQSTTSDRLMER